MKFRRFANEPQIAFYRTGALKVIMLRHEIKMFRNTMTFTTTHYTWEQIKTAIAKLKTIAGANNARPTTKRRT